MCDYTKILEVIKWVGGVGEEDGAEEEEDGWDHGLAEDLSASYHHGRDQAGFSAEVAVGGFSAVLGPFTAFRSMAAIGLHPTIRTTTLRTTGLLAPGLGDMHGRFPTGR